MTETTVKTPVSEREVKTTDVTAWANKEVVPVLRELRQFANAEAVAQVQLATSGGGDWTALWTSDPIPIGLRLGIAADVLGYSAVDTVHYGRVATFHNLDGTVLPVGATTDLFTHESSAGADIRFRVVGQTVLIEVMDDGTSYVFSGLVRTLTTKRP